METIDRVVLTFVLNALWQIPAVVILGLLMDHLLRRGPARHRHAFWLGVVVVSVFLPLASIGEPGRSDSARPETATASGALPGSDASWLGWIPSGSDRRAPVSTGVGLTVALLYGLSLVFHGLRLGRSWRWTVRLAQSGRPLDVPERLTKAVARCRATFGVSGVPILGSPEVGGPVTVGAWRPVVLLPCSFYDSASSEETIAALGHELAHVRRRDYAVNVLCELLLLSVTFHPAVRVVRRRLEEAREMACDEAVLEFAMGPRAYARSLLSLAAIAAGLPQPSTTLGVLDAHTLEVRMKRILDVGPRMATPRARASLGAALLLLAGIAAAASALSVQAVANGSTVEDLGPFVGTWSGDWPRLEEEPGEAKPMRALDLEILPTGEIVETFYRYKKTSDGPTLVDKQTRTASSFKISGRTLTFTTTVKFQEDKPPVSAEIVASIELQGAGEAVFRVLSHSYFDAAKKRGEPVPPPPPPIAMKRVS
jgi:bla regulator protein blaR1